MDNAQIFRIVFFVNVLIWGVIGSYVASNNETGTFEDTGSFFLSFISNLFPLLIVGWAIFPFILMSFINHIRAKS